MQQSNILLLKEQIPKHRDLLHRLKFSTVKILKIMVVSEISFLKKLKLLKIIKNQIL